MSPTEPDDFATTRPDGPDRPHRRTIDWGAVVWGAASGFGVIVAVAALHAVLDHEVRDFDDRGWVLPLFVLVLVAYGLAGWAAQRVASRRGSGDAPLTHGTLAGIGVLVLWLPLRVLIWVARDEPRGLFAGHDPALRPGQIFGHVVIAAALGMLGAFLAQHAARRGAGRAT